MMKRMASFWLWMVVCIPISMWAQQFVVSHQGSPIYCSVLSKHTVAVCAPFSAYASPYRGQVTIPEQVRYRRHNYRVVTIAAEAFAGCVNLTSVTIPSSVNTIEYGAFRGCMALQQMVVPASVGRVEEGAFARCDAMRSVRFDNPDCLIHREAFRGRNDSLSIGCPQQLPADTIGLLRRDYYTASRYVASRQAAAAIRSHEEDEVAKKAALFREDIRQSMELQHQKYEAQQGQRPEDRPQKAPPKKRTTSLGNRGD